MKSAAFFWLVLLVVFLIAEAACPIHLVSIWFALGALVALLCAALGAPVWLQITLFVVVSGVLLALLWPLAKKFGKRNAVSYTHLTLPTILRV